MKLWGELKTILNLSDGSMKLNVTSLWILVRDSNKIQYIHFKIFHKQDKYFHSMYVYPGFISAPYQDIMQQSVLMIELSARKLTFLI